jgi:hypothetical protein
MSVDASVDTIFEAVGPEAHHQWFVASLRSPGVYYLVELAGAQADRRLTCSCPHGQAVAHVGEARPCRHMRAVNDRLAEMVGRVDPMFLAIRHASHQGCQS